MKRITIFHKLLIILVFGFVVMAMFPRPQYDKENIWVVDENPLVMAHAGGKGMFPGNTMSAFEYSFNLGVDVLEMDVQMTQDGILVLRHGENETGNIRQMSNCDTVLWKEDYQTIKDSCNFGYNFQDAEGDYPYRDMTNEEWNEAGVYLTTLEELFAEFGKDTLYVIEIKADADAQRNDTADALYDLIEQYDLFDEIIVATSFDDISKYIHDQYPSLQLSASHDEAQKMIIHSYTLTGVFYNPGNYNSLQIPTSFDIPIINELDLSTKHLIEEAHRHNMAVQYWTINDLETMKSLIRQGADGIITDYPELLMQAIDEVLAETE
jgi:glycerophosphoryl diester phosphodiesterase